MFLTPQEQATSMRDSAVAWGQVAATQDGDMPWFVTACRSDFMYEEQPPPGYSRYRPFLMIVVHPAKKPALGKVNVCIIDSDKTTRPTHSFQDAVLAPEYAAACLTKLAKSVGARPPEIQFMPLDRGRWTYTSACNLCDALAKATFPATVVPFCFEIPESAHGSARTLAVTMIEEGAMWRECMEVASEISDDIKERMQEMRPAHDPLQGMLQGLTGVERGVPASVAQLRKLFAASAEFRVAKPWQSFNCGAVSLQVQPLPHEVHGSLPPVFVLITKEEEHEERGCFVFESRSDLEASYSDMTGFVCRHACLSFCKPDQCAFRDLDHYAELELPIAKDGLDCFPRWYEVDGPVKKRQASLEDEARFYADVWNSAPHLGWWPVYSIAMRAIAAL
eukprot:COSAG03_NODE_1874_length_3400_cov_2.430476_3_plen_392_part_00